MCVGVRASGNRPKSGVHWASNPGPFQLGHPNQSPIPEPVRVWCAREEHTLLPLSASLSLGLQVRCVQDGFGLVACVRACVRVCVRVCVCRLIEAVCKHAIMEEWELTDLYVAWRTERPPPIVFHPTVSPSLEWLGLWKDV